MKKVISVLLCLAIVLSMSSISVFADELPLSYLNGVRTEVKNVPFMENGFWMVPFKEYLDALGFLVEYDENDGAYKTKVDKIEVSVTPDSTKEVFDLVDIELENETKGVDGDVYVQLDFLSKIYGSNVHTDGNKIYVSIVLKEKGPIVNETFDEYLSTLPEPETIFDMEDVFNHGEVEDNEYRTVKVVDLPEGEKFDKVLQMYNKKKLANNTHYRSRITLRLPVEVQQDEVLVMTFWVRSIQSSHESGGGQFDVNFENATTYFKMFECVDATVGKEWTKMECAFRATEYLKPNDATCGFRIGFFEQTLQFADFHLYNYRKTYDSTIYKPSSTSYFTGDVSIYKEEKDTYYGREEGALWREEALKRIEKYRVRDIKVNVKDEQGNTIPDALVKANMTRSEFHWGTMVQWNPTYNSTHITPKFNSLVLKHFNAVSEGNALKKEYWEPYGVTRTADFAIKNHLYNRCHVMTNGTDLPDSYPSWPGQTDKATFSYEDYLMSFASWASMRFYNWGDTFDEIDIRNEVTSWQDNELVWGSKVVADIFKIANDISPDSLLFVNEAGINGEEKRWDRAYEFRKILDDYKSYGAPIDGVGFEAHFYFPIYPQLSYNQIEYVLSNDMKYATWTEYDFVSTADDKEVAADVEADHLRDSIIIAYSHPRTIGFHMWGFADPNHWRGNAPLYDWFFYQKEKKVKYWDDLVWGEWFTQTEGKSDENGLAAMRGHRGEYDITVQYGNKTAKTTLVVSDKGENTVNAVVTDSGITLESSEPVVYEKKSIPLPLEAEYNDNNVSQLWKELYRSKVDTVVNSNGEDISFIGGNDQNISFFRDESRNNCEYVLNSDESIVAKLSDTLDSGVVKISMPTTSSIAMPCRIEGRTKDGEWKLIGTCDNLNQKYIPFDFPVDEIRINVVREGKVQINNIHVSQKEWVI